MRTRALALYLVIGCAGNRSADRANEPRPAETAAVSPSAAPAAQLGPFVSSEPIEPVTARFPLPVFQRPSFPAKTFEVTKFGAVEGGQVKNTAAFRQAIVAAASAGGGTVLVPAGRWLTGPIRLESNVNLHVAEHAVLLFSQDFADYLPPVFTRWEGLEVMNYSPLVYAKDCENVAITGAGTLDGQGQAWWPWKKTQKDAAQRLYELASSGTPPEERVFGVEGGLRPSFIQTVGCKNVLVEGVTITSGPMWTIHPIYSENVIVRRVTVRTDGPNNDGFNPDSCKNVLVEDSFFSTGDDCVVIKSGLNEDGWRVGRPSENIVVRRLKGERGHGGVVIGSEMSGGVRNVHVEDCEFTGTDRGLRIKAMRGRGGVIENVYYENVRHKDLRLFDVEITTFYRSSTVVPLTQKPPTIRNVQVRNVTGSGAKTAIEITGLPELPIEDVTFENVTLSAESGVRCTDCRGVHFKSAKIEPASGPAYRLENVGSVTLDAACTGDPKACVELVGKNNTAVTIDGAKVPASSARKVPPQPSGTPPP